MDSGTVDIRNIVDRINDLYLPNDDDDMDVEDFESDILHPILSDALIHILLPKQTPDQLQVNLEEIEQFLLQTATNSAINILEKVHLSELESIKLMLEKWTSLQPTSWNRSNFLRQFPEAIARLQEGQTIPIYVRNQNSALIITKHMDKSTSLSTFRCNLPSHLVMSNVRGELSMGLPETREIVQNTDLLSSQAFAKQLHEISTAKVDISVEKFSKGRSEFSSTREVADTKLVTDWIVGLLVPQECSQSLKSIKIQKKFRDQVCLNANPGSSQLLPFRRSGMYMALKGAIQLKLEEILENKDIAKLVYKLVILNMITDLASQFSVNDIFSMDLATQLLAKLGRRVLKLENLYKEMLPLSSLSPIDSVEALKTNSMEYVLSVVKELTAKMKSIWNLVSNQQALSQNHPPLLSYQHTEEYFHHKIPRLDEFIHKLKTRTSTPSSFRNQEVNSSIESSVLTRYTTLQLILDGVNSDGTASAIHVWLYDTENYIKYGCKCWNKISLSSIHQLFTLYMSIAKLSYKNDPLGKSQVYLVSLKCLEILDRIVTQAHPLLLEYQPEVNKKIFDHLLLPYQKDMKLLDGLMVYFKNREKRATPQLPSILSSNCIKPNTFSVQYAQRNKQMIDLRTKILQDTEIAIDIKYTKFEGRKELCNSLINKISSMSGPCTCTSEIQKKKKKRLEVMVKKICEKCTLENDLKTQRKSVTRYERPLPVDETLQWAVVFELLIPPNFSIFRDYLAQVKFELWGEQNFNDNHVKKNNSWVQYSGINRYKNENAGSPEYIQMGSPTMPLSCTSRTKTSALDVLVAPFEAFIIDNGMGCVYYYTGEQQYLKYSVQNECCFKLNTTSNHEPYSNSNLQITLESTDHTQNGILARQNECHQKLSLEEFIVFGSLRAGHRIQLRNLFQAISSDLLSLAQEAVLALILQTIWQVGPVNEATNERECHWDFSCEDTQFGEEFLDMLDKLVKRNEANYSNSLILIVAVVITRRIAELNANLTEICYGMLKRWRAVMFGWISKIETALDKPEVASAHGGVSTLRKNLLEIIICSMLSYSVADWEDISMVIEDQEDVVHWLQTLYHWNHLQDQPVPTSGFLTILQNFVKIIPLRINLEEEICVGRNLLIASSLNKFIEENWSKARECSLERIHVPFLTKRKASLVIAEYLEEDGETRERITHQIYFDFALGTFLVNGFSQSTLPLDIKNHKLFQVYFEETSNLRTQRDSAHLVRTAVPFRGKHYEFHQNVFRIISETLCYLDETLIIQEIQEACSSNPTKLILLDPQRFSQVLSNYFIRNYTHWLDITLQCVYFRPRKRSLDIKYDYVLKCNVHNNRSVWTLFDVVSGEQILSIYSKGFIQISQALERLDLKNYITVTHNDGNATITATLRRYNLRFTLNLDNNKKSHQEEQHLESVEYPGYHVASNQKCLGTLIGLEQGMVLENGEKRLVLMPHSNIEYFLRDGKCHQSCSISLEWEHLRQPPYFVYQVDDVLKRLKAHNSKPAWLYLAALHAVTSSSFFPDPFTEVTGTEMVMRILQSACIWSCSPYDEESLATLNFIKSLSPNRKWYGHLAQRNEKKREEGKGSIEITSWPQDVPTMVAHDAFAIIVDKLIEDSEKLEMLHRPHSPKKLYTENYQRDNENLSGRLHLRAYFRHISMYNAAATLEYPKYFTCKHLTLSNSEIEKVHLPSAKKSEEESQNVSNMQHISFLSLAKCLKSPTKTSLVPFILSLKYLSINLSPLSSDHLGGFNDLLNLNFQDNWLQLYTMATSSKTTEDLHLFHIILAAMVYSGAPLDQVVNLHCISEASRSKLGNDKFPPVPINLSSAETSYFTNPAENNYEISTIKYILSMNAKPFTSSQLPVAPNPPSSSTSKYCSSAEKLQLQTNYKKDLVKYTNDLREYYIHEAAYKKQIEVKSSQLSVQFKKFWPCENISLDSVPELLKSSHFNPERVVTEINEKLSNWYRNYKLTLFLNQVQRTIDKFWGKLELLNARFSYYVKLTGRQKHQNIHFIKDKELTVSFGNIINIIKTDGLPEVSKIFEHGSLGRTSTGKKQAKDLLSQREHYKETVQNILCNLVNMLTNTVPAQILYQTGISLRLAPVCILNILKRQQKIQHISTDEDITYLYAGALGVLWTHLKRLNRGIQVGNGIDPPMEMENFGHENWSPKKYPEWLLLELELDIMIRPIQVKVAKQMIQMPNGGNGVTQLNMGEGKTSVIVPMLCATLAKRNDQLCRVTALSSMFKMNLNSLTFSIGGLLNKRVYSVPCKRDMNIDEETVNRIEQVYQECLEMEGVILTLPEYRLSFRLLAYDKMYKKEWMLGQMMLNVENFLRQFARDVLDESDELFNVKYQLVYTIGEQIPVDGGDLRWLLCQKILDIVHKVGIQLIEKCGAGNIEFQPNLQNEHPHEFSTFRLLGDDTCEKDFASLLANTVLGELRIPESDKQVVRIFLVEEEVGTKLHKKVLESIFSGDNPDTLNKILILSGYLRRGVLGLALTKRWKVEYGVNPKPDFTRLMAVPFRAKDVAAEKTEFGHPDLAIILTHLSYYYSGLNDNQLMEVFHILRGRKSPASVYSMWISKIPKKLVPDVFEHYYSLNMKDVSQKAKLFEMLRKHKMVIDFWLSNCVFPRESKQFPGKLVMTAWDLCYERQRLPVTGFSGTNDSQVLLPLMITQQDLGELQSTNENVERTLLQRENGINHKGFPMGVTCKEILRSMKQDELTVLIDAGALMLECSNEQIANLWLKLNSSIEAVVFFNENNEFLVKSRDYRGQDIPFVLSPYQGRLEKCGVFLDDQHTRGTDLKFPVGSKACVTVATRMKRDKLIQACLRMRKLGMGHSVTFYLSHEAHDKIGVGEITTKGVLDWVCQNTRESNQDGLLYWALAGRNYSQRLAAEDHFHFPSVKKPWAKNKQTEMKTAILANQCVDLEVIKLCDMYGQHTQMECLKILIPKWFAFTKLKLEEKGGGQPMEQEIILKLNEICNAVTLKCLEYAPTKKQMFSSSGGMMEEEQEKELELEKEAEVEEERQLERPRKAEAADHFLHPKVKAFAIYGGQIQVNKECLLHIPEMFQNTTFWDQVQPESWPECVFVTKDFVSTISTNFKTDSYLRPIQYLISYTPPSSSGKIQLLIISPFEANELLPHFRKYQSTKCKLHIFFTRRSEKQDLLLNTRRLQLPPSSDMVIKYVIPPNGPEIASLLLASGNLYFNSMEEQKAFLLFLGLFPQPWGKLPKAAFDRGWITNSGFWLPEFRSILYQQGFQRDPTGLVKKILLCRHSTVSELTHLMRILNEQQHVRFSP